MHWTQRPENKEKVRAMASKGAKTRNSKTRAHTVIRQAAAEKHRDHRPIITEMIKMLRQRRDALTTAIAVLQEEARRG